MKFKKINGNINLKIMIIIMIGLLLSGLSVVEGSITIGELDNSIQERNLKEDYREQINDYNQRDYSNSEEKDLKARYCSRQGLKPDYSESILFNESPPEVVEFDPDRWSANVATNQTFTFTYNKPTLKMQICRIYSIARLKTFSSF